MTSPLEIESARWPEDAETVRRLFVRYAEWLAVDLCFEDFEGELAALPGAYAAPRGGLWLLCDGASRALGCVGLRPLGLAGTCELKRLWVEAPARGGGWGRKLAEAAIGHAVSQGYRRMVLDTLEHLDAAIALYRRLDFRPIPPYADHPIPGTVCFGLDLPGGTGADDTQAVPRVAPPVAGL